MYLNAFLPSSEFLYNLLGTLACTDAAAHALVVIYVRYEVLYVYSILRTVSLAHSTAYTARCTCLHNHGSLILVGAGHLIFTLLRLKLDEMLRTVFNTFSADLTLIGIHYCYAVDNVYGIELADAHTGSAAHAAVRAILGSLSGCHGKEFAVLLSRIIIFIFGLVTGSRTFYIGRLGVALFYLFTQYLIFF